MATKTVDDLSLGEQPDEPLVVNDDNLEKTVAAFPFVVVDCWAPWCGPCQMLSPSIDALAKEMKGNVVFGKLNTDENQKTAMAQRIMAIPTLLIYKNGNLEDRISGVLPKDVLKGKLEEYI